MFKHKSIPTSTSVEFINLEPQSPLVSKGMAKVLYLGANRNGSFFTKDVVNKMIPSLYGIPVVGKYEAVRGDFLGHEKQTTLGRDGKARQVPLTVPYGYVPENANVWYQKFMDDDQVEREYLCCDVKMWTGRYPEAYRVVTKGNHQSMELDPETMNGEWAIADKEQTEYFMVSEAYFSALCILGQDVEPCFEGAGIAHEFSNLTEEDRIFLFELDKAIEKVKGEYKMGKVNDYMSVEDVKLMLEAGSGEPDVSHVQNGLPTNGTVTPADNIVTPAEGLATDANFEDNKEMPKTDCEVTKEEGDEAAKNLEQVQKDPGSETQEQKSEAGKELEQLQQEEKKGEVPPTDGEKPPFPPKEGKPEIDEDTGKPEIDDDTGLPEVEDDMSEVPNAMNPTVAEGLDPVSKIDQIMVEDKDVLETELLKKILELLEGRISGVPVGPAANPAPPTDNAPALPQQAQTPVANVEQAPPTGQIPNPGMPAEQPTPEVATIRRQFELEIKQMKSEYEALQAKHEALMGEFTKLQEFKLQIEMNEKEQVIGEYSMLPQSVLDELKEKAKTLSKEDLEAKCALALVKSSKKEVKDNHMISYSYGQAPQNDFLMDLEAAINKTNK